MARLSRSAGSPALPTAITIRPQLASSAASAVLTRGELPMARAIVLADCRRRPRPEHGHLDELGRSLAVADDLVGQVEVDRIEGFDERIPPGRPDGPSIGGFPALPVANSSTVSLVEVSESTVIRL